MSKTEVIGDMLVLPIFGNQVEFDAEVICWWRQDALVWQWRRSVHIPHRFSWQPKIVEDFCECPPGCNAFTWSPRRSLMFFHPN